MRNIELLRQTFKRTIRLAISIVLIGWLFNSYTTGPAQAQYLAEPQQALTSLLDQLNKLANEQRSALSRETLDVISEVTLNTERLIREAGIVTGSLEERVAADSRAALAQAEQALRELIAQVRDGTASSIQQASLEANRTVANASASLQNAIAATRPVLANAERVGDELIVRTEGAVSTLVLRVTAGAILLLVAVAAIISVMRRRQTAGSWERTPLLAAMALLAIAAFVFAPRISWAFAEEQRFKDPNVDCRALGGEGKLMMLARERGEAVDRGLAERVRDAAARCHLLSSNATEAGAAERYLSEALEALGVPLVCRSNTQCAARKVCDLTSGECLPRGVYCDFPADCSSDKVCDPGKRRCVDPAKYDCAPPERPCQAGQICLSKRCVSPPQAEIGGPCAPAGRFGICGEPAAGKWERTERGERACVAHVVAKAEECNGADDNCNGHVDDAIGGLSQDCVATEARGRCRNGKTACERGKPVCVAAPRGDREICVNDIDEDCDGRLNNGCPVELVETREIHCGSFGAGCHQMGGSCKAHFVKDTVEMQGPVSGGLNGWWKWVEPNNPSDCKAEICCESKDLFKGGSWRFRVLAKPQVTAVP